MNIVKRHLPCVPLKITQPRVILLQPEAKVIEIILTSSQFSQRMCHRGLVLTNVPVVPDGTLSLVTGSWELQRYNLQQKDSKPINRLAASDRTPIANEKRSFEVLVSLCTKKVMH